MAKSVPNKLSGPDGFSGNVVFVGHRMTETGIKAFNIDVVAKDRTPYLIDFGIQNPTRRLITKTLMFFRHDAVFRRHFETCDLTPDWAFTSSTTLAQYDPVANAYFQDLGLSVSRYNKGSQHPRGSHCVLGVYGSFPQPILSITRANGWLRSDNRIELTMPRGFSHMGPSMLMLLLDDWASDCLDTTGARYKVVREPKPLFPDWPAYPQTALQENQQLNEKKAERLNRLLTLANFDQYVRLTSGRDCYSSLSLDDLIKRLEGDEVIDGLNQIAENPTLMAKALRWRMRGLNVMHTLEKYRVDEILHNNAEQMREQRSERRAQEHAALESYLSGL